MKQYDSNKTAWFVIVGDVKDKIDRGGTISFRGYTDHAGALGKAGAYVEYITSRDANGKGKGKQFVIDSSRRRFQVRLGEQDASDKPITQYDFLKNYPECEGSPNGHYQDLGNGERVQLNISFREMDEERDAEMALEADNERVLAEASALKLDDGTLEEIAVFIGLSGKANKMMRFKVREFAQKRPKEYNKLLNSGDRPLRALVRRAIAQGILTQKGPVIFWENSMIGGDEDSAMSTLYNDKRLLEALKSKVDIEVDVQAKNKGGRPTKEQAAAKAAKNAEEK